MKKEAEKTCLALITARGGSKGVPRKNIRALNGLPLIEYPIRRALDCSFISRVIVTTESEEIRQTAIQAGAEAPFLRPAEMATDLAKQEDAIMHAMDWVEANDKKYDYICLLCPTTPLGSLETLNEAFERLKASAEAEAIFSVYECDFSPERCSRLREDGFMKDWMDEKIKWANRQELKPYYRLSGLITISTWEAFRREQTFLHDKTLWFTVDPVEALDINTPFEFFVAENLLKNGYRNSADLKKYIAQKAGV